VDTLRALKPVSQIRKAWVSLNNGTAAATAAGESRPCEPTGSADGLWMKTKTAGAAIPALKALSEELGVAGAGWDSVGAGLAQQRHSAAERQQAQAFFVEVWHADITVGMPAMSATASNSVKVVRTTCITSSAYRLGGDCQETWLPTVCHWQGGWREVLVETMKRFGIFAWLVLALALPAWAEDSADKVSIATPVSVTAKPGVAVDLVVTVNVKKGWHIQSPKPAEDFLIATHLEMLPEAGVTFGPVQYPATEKVTVAGERVEALGGKVELKFQATVAVAGKKTLRGKLDIQACDDKTCIAPATLDVTVPIEVAGEPVKAAMPVRRSVWGMLAAAFVGGLLLNLMPCVLPVISLKILGFVQQGASRKLGLLYGAGVVVSLWVLAAAVIGLKMAGRQVGWGFQFQDVRFVLAMALLCTVIALNLFGVFEFSLGVGATQKVSEAAGHGGSMGAFLNGILAVLLATPCTAPLLAPALGFAFSASAPVVFAALTMVALGLALPYVVLSWDSRWLKWLPKPGPWLTAFKQAMAFPMLATALWLAWVVETSYGATAGMGAVAWLMAAAFLVWLAGALRPGRMLWVVVALVLAVGLGRWKLAPVLNAGSEPAMVEKGGLIDWKPYSKAALAEALKTEQPVFVDFTASWCLTCQVNKRTSIEVPLVAAAFKEQKVIALLADWTRPNAEIGEALRELGRSGVPAYVLYPVAAERKPVLLPEVLTPQIVLDALK